MSDKKKIAKGAEMYDLGFQAGLEGREAVSQQEVDEAYDTGYWQAFSDIATSLTNIMGELK